MGQIDKAVEAHTNRLFDSVFGTEDAPEDTRSDVRRFLDDYSDEGFLRDCGDICLGSDTGTSEIRTMVSLIEDAYTEPHSERRTQRINNYRARIGQLVYQSVCEFAEGWEQ